MKPLKDQFFNPEFYIKLSEETKKVYPDLDEKQFYLAITDNYESLELMERLKQCSLSLFQFLPNDYPEALSLLLKIAVKFDGFVGVLFPDLVATYGLDYYKISVSALGELTKYSTSEFAIRPFLKKYPVETVQQMEEWSQHENEHVRRLSSEGIRPLLPWSFKLTEHLNYPEVSRNILTNLNNDKSLYVRKSVGNHLNDLTKHHAGFVIDLIHSWDNTQPYTAWIVKKGLRTLIKNGDQRVFEFLGYPKPTMIAINELRLSDTAIEIGGETAFSFKLINQSDQEVPVLVDYIVNYVKKSGAINTKVFKLKEFPVAPNEQIILSKKLLFKQLSTRTHYSGKHKIEVLVNGEVKAEASFSLL